MMREDLLIRRAHNEDLPAIVELWKEIADFHADLDRYFALAPSATENVTSFLQQRMSDDASEIWVAEHRGRVFGYCLAVIAERPLAFLERRCGKIIDLAVTSEYRRRGAGRALVEHACEWFRSQGVDGIELNVATSNDVGRAFWQSLGFAPTVETRYQRF